MPLDVEGRLFEIGPDLARDLGIFSGYTGFREARLFQRADSSFVLEILYSPGAAVVQDRRDMSAEDIRDLRERISELVRTTGARVQPTALDQHGRGKLLAGPLALSLAYYGWAVPYMLDVDDAKGFICLYMFTSAAAFFGPFVATRDAPVSNAAASLALYGASRGTGHGVLLDMLLLRDDIGSDDSVRRRRHAFAVLTSWAEGIAGYRIATSARMEAGHADAIGLGGDFGAAYGAGVAFLAGGFDDDHRRGTAGAVLLGSGLGMAGGNWLARHEPLTSGDVHMMRYAGLLGAYVGLSAVEILERESDEDRAGWAMLGSAAGLAASAVIAKTAQLRTDQSLLIGAGSLAAGLLATGVAYVASSENTSSDARGDLLLAASAVGATAGFAILTHAFARRSGQEEERSSLEFELDPAGCMALAMRGGETDSRGDTLPLVRLRFHPDGR